MKYTIYQLNELRETPYGFMSWSFAQKHEFSIDDYQIVYSGSIPARMLDSEYADAPLEYLWKKFNLDHPEDFIGHSLSVSDVVKLTDANNVNRYYYCDSIGWRDVTNAVLSAA